MEREGLVEQLRSHINVPSAIQFGCWARVLRLRSVAKRIMR